MKHDTNAAPQASSVRQIPDEGARPAVAAPYPRDNALELARSEAIGVLAWKAGHGNETLPHPDQALLARSFLAVASELEYRDKTTDEEVELYRTQLNDANHLVAELREQLRAALSETQPTKYILPPADANGKRPRLFYWEDAEDCWCPAEGLEVDNIISVDLFLSDGGIEEIRFKRQDMTDAEFDAIPEG